LDLKFVALIKSFFPDGKFWEFRNNFGHLIDGMSVEFSRAYEKAKLFYSEFNIINSESLAREHSQDYLIKQGLYTNRELQRIIVEYLNKDFQLEEIINDFADFIGADIEYSSIVNPFMVGRNTTGNRLGDINYNSNRMLLYIKFNDIYDIGNIAKIKELMRYLKPPYLRVIYNTTSDVINIPFIVGRNTAGNPLGQIIT